MSQGTHQYAQLQITSSLNNGTGIGLAYCFRHQPGSLIYSISHTILPYSVGLELVQNTCSLTKAEFTHGVSVHNIVERIKKSHV